METLSTAFFNTFHRLVASGDTEAPDGLHNHCDITKYHFD